MPTGRRKLLGAFQVFFREHSEHWLGRFDYAEAGSQLILQAFLQRVVNGGGRIEREYGLGRGRTDLLIVWPRGGATPCPEDDRFVIECKVAHKDLERTIGEGVGQTAGYMDRCVPGPVIWSCCRHDSRRPASSRTPGRSRAHSAGSWPG